jgi:hypothetical protein
VIPEPTVKSGWKKRKLSPTIPNAVPDGLKRCSSGFFIFQEEAK